MELENDLIPYRGIKPAKLRIENFSLYRKVTAYAKSVNLRAGDIIGIFRVHGSLNEHINCVQCGCSFSVYCRRGVTCSKKCQSLHMHETRTDEVKAIVTEKLRISNDNRRESGDLSETSRRAFASRRKNHTPEQIAEQYQRVGRSSALTAKLRRERNREILIKRIQDILKRKSPILILRLYYANGLIKTYEDLVNFFIDLGFVEFSIYLNAKKYRYAIRHGLRYISYCSECGIICSSGNMFCSYECVGKSDTNSAKISMALKQYYSVPENRSKLSSMLVSKHARKSPEERHKIAKKIYSGKTQEWIDNKSDKAVATRIERGQILSRDKKIKTEYNEYRKSVSRLTKMNSFRIPGIEMRGKHTMHIDHIYPIVMGYMNKIPPELISDLRNLRMLDAIENKRKNGSITIVPEHIMEYMNAENNKRTL